MITFKLLWNSLIVMHCCIILSTLMNLYRINNTHQVTMSHFHRQDTPSKEWGEINSNIYSVWSLTTWICGKRAAASTGEVQTVQLLLKCENGAIYLCKSCKSTPAIVHKSGTERKSLTCGRRNQMGRFNCDRDNMSIILKARNVEESSSAQISKTTNCWINNETNTSYFYL